MTRMLAGAMTLYFDAPLPEGTPELALDFVPARSMEGDVVGVGRVTDVDVSDDRCRVTISLDFTDTPSLEDMAEAARDE